VPGAVGTYSFTVAVSDASGVTFNFPGSIVVQSNQQFMPILLMILSDD